MILPAENNPATILRAWPETRGILFDQPSVIDMACRNHLAENFAGRLKLEQGDFFVKVPVGADLYLLKQIIHDWEDPQCIQILSNCRQAMQPGGRILVIDEIVVPGQKIPPLGALIDLQLRLLMTGRKRSETEHLVLFAEAGLRLVRTWPTESTYAILETAAL